MLKIMPKGKNNRKRDKELRRRLEGENQSKIQGATCLNVREIPQTAEEPQANLTSHFKNDELIELYRIFNTKELSEAPLLVGAVAMGKFYLVQRLLDENYPVNCYGPDRMTPLMWAVKNKSVEMIGLLLQRDADVNLVDDKGDNALMIALQDPTWDEELFITFWTMVKDGENFDFDYANNAGNTIFHYAIKKQWIFLIQSLLLTNVNVNCATNRGVTPLILAGTHNHYNVVKLLMGAGADMSQEDEYGCTVLCYAFASVVQKRRHSSLLQHLLTAVDSEKPGCLSIKHYIERRLHLLLHPPKECALFVKAITNVITHVLSFFVRCLVTGVQLLLGVNVFAKITAAIERHLDDATYCHALMGVMFELVRHCRCCVDAVQTDGEGEQLRNAFVEEGGANACLSVLQKHCGSARMDDAEIAVAALIPLLSVCDGTPCDNAFCIWLEAHYHEVIPFYKAFSNIKVITINLNTDRRHIRELNKKIKSFKNIMTTLEQKRMAESLREKAQTFVDRDLTLLVEAFGDQCESFKLSRKKVGKKTKLKLEEMRRQKLIDINGVSSELKDEPLIECLKYGEQNVEVVDNVSIPVLREPNEQTIQSDCKNNTGIEPKEEQVNVHSKYELMTETYNNPPCVDAADAKNGEPSHSDCQTINISAVTKEDHGKGVQMLNDANAKKELNKCMETCSNPDREKGLTGAIYIDNMFREILNRFLEVWRLEKSNNFPGHYVNTQTSGDDITLQILCQILPRLEHEYLQQLNSIWQSLIQKLRLSEKNTFHKYIGRLDILLQCYLIDIENVLKNENAVEMIDVDAKVVDHPIRKRRIEVLPTTEDRNCKKPRISHEDRKPPVICSSHRVSARCSYENHIMDDATTEGRSQSRKCRCIGNDETLQNNFPVLNSKCNARKKTGAARSIRAVGKHLSYVVSAKKPFAARATCKNGTCQGNTVPRVISRDFRKMVFSSCMFRALRRKGATNNTYNVKTIATSSTSAPQIDDDFVSFFSRLASLSTTTHANQNDVLPVAADILATGHEGMCAGPASSGLRCDAQSTTASSGKDNVCLRDIKVPTRRLYNLVHGECFRPKAAGLSDENVYIKSVCVENPHMTEALKETLNSLRKIRHTNIAHLIAYFQRGYSLLLGNPLCKYNLPDYLDILKAGGMIGDHSKNLISQMVTGLSFLHKIKNPITHGNLKPTNILIDNSGVVKLADFGLDNMLHRCECPAPASQIWWSRDTHLNYSARSPLHLTPKTDVQTTGMLLHYVATGGSHPYGVERDDDIVGNVLRGHLLISRRLGDELEHLVVTMLVDEPADRPTVAEALKHLYFWDVARKWGFVLACSGIASAARHLALATMDNFHDYLDDRMMLKMDLWCWISQVRSRFPMMEPISSRFSDSPSGLLRFIRSCVDRNQKIAPFSFSLRDFFLTTFTTLPLTLYQLVDNTEWLQHQAFYLNENFK